MSMTNIVRPLCFTCFGSVRAMHDAEARDVRERRPHLLAVEHPLVAVAHRPRREAADVGARARLAEHLAPDLLAREERAEVAAASARRSRASRSSARTCRVRSGCARRAAARPRAVSLALTMFCSFGDRPSPPYPSGKCTHASPEVVLRAEHLGRASRSSGRARRGARRSGRQRAARRSRKVPRRIGGDSRST